MRPRKKFVTKNNNIIDMVQFILFPALSPTMETGKIARWLVKIGDMVEPGDELMEVETDKAVMVHESIETGKIGAILVEEGGEEISVNTPIAVILDEGEVMEDVDLTTLSTLPSSNEKKQEKNELSAPVAQKPSDNNIATKRDNEKNKTKKIFITPLARAIAKQNKINIEQITGTGPLGRIIKKDIEEALANASHKPLGDASMFSANKQAESFELSKMRKTIAQRLVAAKRNIPHFYLKVSCNADKLMEAREAFNEESQVRISINDIIVKACAQSLMKVPDVNRQFNEDSIIQYKDADISIAVSVEEGLYTPIIFKAQELSLSEIAIQTKSLSEKAKLGTLLPSEYEGGSFSISNLGMFGISEFSAIINPPQASILAVGAIEKSILLDEKTEQMRIGHKMNLTLSCDHRIIDGVLGARFLNTIKSYLEEPIKLFV